MPYASELAEWVSAAWKKTQPTEQSAGIKCSITSALGNAESDAIWNHTGHSEFRGSSAVGTEGRFLIAKGWESERSRMENDC